MNQLRERPGTMKRFVDGVDGEFFFQKRVPKGAPDWLQTATFTFPSGRSATELVANDAAHLVWAVNLGVIDFNPHPVRRADLDCPDELRVDLDPQPGVRWDTVRKVAMCVKEVLDGARPARLPEDVGLARASTSTSGSSPRWDYVEVRRAALALAREVERREPKRATSKWWKEERHGVFVDYNQNARDRTIASGYSVRPSRTPASAARSVGRGPRRRAGRAAARHRPGAGRRRRGTPRRTSTSTPARWTRCWSWPTATRRRASATRPGRPTSEAERRAEARAAEPGQAEIADQYWVSSLRRAERPMDTAMEANQYAFVHGMARTRLVPRALARGPRSRSSLGWFGAGARNLDCSCSRRCWVVASFDPAGPRLPLRPRRNRRGPRPAIGWS